MSTCNCCFDDYIVKCTDNINVFAKLEPATQYEWVITDKFEREYSGIFTTDADGFWQIPVSDLPGGLLTEFSGDFKLRVYEFEVYPNQTKCAAVVFKIAQDYDCITFNARAGTREKNNLGCQF